MQSIKKKKVWDKLLWYDERRINYFKNLVTELQNIWGFLDSIIDSDHDTLLDLHA